MNAIKMYFGLGCGSSPKGTLFLSICQKGADLGLRSVPAPRFLFTTSRDLRALIPGVPAATTGNLRRQRRLCGVIEMDGRAAIAQWCERFRQS
jgi:hypothetical protein